MNDLILEELKKKYPDYFQQFQPIDIEAKKKEAEEKKSTIPMAQLAAGVGAALSKRDPTQTLNAFETMKSNIDEDIVGSAEKKNKEMLDFYLKQKLMEQQAEDARLDRDFKRSMMSEQMKERSLARQEKSLAQRMKEDELSAAQAKQLGLAEMGQLANKQYEEAILKGKEKGEFDPTDVKQFIDNSDSIFIPDFLKSKSALEAQASMSAWVESYLRDASGASIPKSERLSYAKDYFPMPGDSPEIMRNKEMLRKQKEKNALIGAGPGAKKFSQSNEFPKQVRKDGKVATVKNQEEYNEALSEGWK